MIPIILCLQVLPLMLFPPSSYSVKTQEWWLPAFLTLLTIISLVKILLRRDLAAWPWYLLSFSQGFNIISRMMMLMPHAASYSTEGGGLTANVGYIVIAFGTMLFSGFEIWYCELPEMRQRLASRQRVKTAG